MSLTKAAVLFGFILGAQTLAEVSRPTSLKVSGEVGKDSFKSGSASARLGLDKRWQIRGGYTYSDSKVTNSSQSFYGGASWKLKPLSVQSRFEVGILSSQVRSHALNSSLDWKLSDIFQLNLSLIPSRYRDSSSGDVGRHIEFGLGSLLSLGESFDISIDASIGSLNDENSVASSSGVIQNRYSADLTYFFTETFSAFASATRAKYFGDSKIIWTGSFGTAVDLNENLSLDFSYSTTPKFKAGLAWIF